MARRIVAISTGDVDGIGLEITQKALSSIKIPADIQIHVYSQSPLARRGVRATSHLEASQKSESCVNVLLKTSPPQWVEDIAKLCVSGHIAALVTGPLSKGLIFKSGFKDMGHTEILKRVSQEKNAFMGFVGKNFNVLLATGHIPLEKIPGHLKISQLEQAIEVGLKSRALLKKSDQNKPLGILGLNPHAGDGGLIGDFENKIMMPILRRYSSREVQGPLIPDVAFQKQNWGQFSFYIALYHDQGLIPFKMSHGFGGVHITLGLKIKRCSVDHGTAKDIFGKGLANPQSMIDSIKLGIKLAKKVPNSKS